MVRGISLWIGAGVLAAAGHAQAIDFDQVLTEGAVGAGANQAMIVADWNGGTTPSHAWLFLWDDGATFADAFDAIQAAFDFSWSQAPFVTEFDYDDGTELHLGNSDGWMSFWNSADGESWATNDLGIYEQPLVDGGWAGVNAEGIVNNWPGEAPSAPLIPEPASLAMVTIGAAALLRRGGR